jgi:transmembrane sensor
MSDRERQGSSDRLEAAAAWAVRLEGDAATEADWLAFSEWLAEPDNGAAYDAIQAAQLDVEAHREELARALAASEGERGRARPATSRRSSGGARSAGAMLIAGGMLAAAAVALFVWPRGPVQPPGAAPVELAFAAPVDRSLPVTLPDGSSAILNRGASMTFRANEKTREVRLEHGEAAFAVRHDPSHPFSVVAGDQTISDIGTEFNVLQADEALVVTVRTGAVRLQSAGASPVDVTQGHQIRLDRQTRLATLSQVDPEGAFAWRDGRLVYHDATLATIVTDLNRYGRTHIRIDGPGLSGLKFSGVLVIGTSENMIEQMQAFLPVRSEQARGEIVLRAR